MVQKWIRASLFVALGLVAVALSVGVSATAQDKKDGKTPDIKTIMTEGHKGTDAFLAKIKGEAKAGKWEDAQTHAKALVVFGEALGKNTPPKGDEKSWEKLTKAYHENTKAVVAATEKKDAKATEAALGTITKSCMGCHSAHKGK